MAARRFALRTHNTGIDPRREAARPREEAASSGRALFGVYVDCAPASTGRRGLAPPSGTRAFCCGMSICSRLCSSPPQTRSESETARRRCQTQQEVARVASSHGAQKREERAALWTRRRSKRANSWRHVARAGRAGEPKLGHRPLGLLGVALYPAESALPRCSRERGEDRLALRARASRGWRTRKAVMRRESD